MLLMKKLKRFLKSMNTVKSKKKCFNHNLIMSEEEQIFQSSNTCWIYEKLIEITTKKVRDHCHITGKFRNTTR